MTKTRQRLTDRAAGAVDLLIDFATLGEYGLEPVPAPGAGACEGAVPAIRWGGWEALGRARRGGCQPGGSQDARRVAALR